MDKTESPRKVLVTLSGAPIFAAITWDTSTWPGSLVASRAYVHRSHRTVNNEKRVLKQLQTLGCSKRQQIQKLRLSVKEVY